MSRFEIVAVACLGAGLLLVPVLFVVGQIAKGVSQ